MKNKYIQSFRDQLPQSPFGGITPFYVVVSQPYDANMSKRGVFQWDCPTLREGEDIFKIVKMTCEFCHSKYHEVALFKIYWNDKASKWNVDELQYWRTTSNSVGDDNK